MPNYTLAPSVQIAAAVADPTFTGISTARKNQLLGMVSAAANELDVIFAALVGQTADATERAFLRAVVVYDGGNGAGSTPQVIPSGFAGSVTSVGTGTSSSLEQLPTSGLTLPVLRTIYIPGAVGDEVQDWVLLASTAATAAGIQRPNDYSTGSQRVWFRKR